MTVYGRCKGFRKEGEDVGTFGELIDGANVGIGKGSLSDSAADFG